MGFNENDFMLWGTGIAIFGVAYTIWDSKKKEISNTYNKYIPNNNLINHLEKSIEYNLYLLLKNIENIYYFNI